MCNFIILFYFYFVSYIVLYFVAVIFVFFFFQFPRLHFTSSYVFLMFCIFRYRICLSFYINFLLLSVFLF